jgi:hypothetical protein
MESAFQPDPLEDQQQAENPFAANSQALVVLSDYNAQRGIEQIEQTFADLGAVLSNCHHVLRMAPATQDSEQAAARWGKIQQGVITIMMNSQEMAKQMFDAAMKIKVVHGSIEQMEKTLFADGQTEPMRLLSVYASECRGNIEIAKKAAEIMSKTHSEEVNLIRDNFEALCADMGS